MDTITRTPEGAAFTRLILEVFRFNGQLLAAGDALCRDLGLTSARWQVMGAIDESALPVAHIARNMGLTRQGVQRIANELAGEGFVMFEDNPHHRRAKLLRLTEKGRLSLDEINRRQAEWSSRMARGFPPDAIDAAAGTLAALRRHLDASAAPAPEIRPQSP
jgi:DNA-binding MarR family transcriptional regulator